MGSAIGGLLLVLGLLFIVAGGKSKGEQLFAALFGTAPANAGPAIKYTGTPGAGIGQPTGPGIGIAH